MKTNRLIIGLDYGTTYTGVSYCETSESGSQDEHIEVIVDWPSQHTLISTKEKVPSEVTYQEGGLIWGSLIPPHVQRHMWTKLQIDPKQQGQVAKIVREVSTSTQNLHKQPVEIIADFLSQVKAHLIKNLDRKYGKMLWRSLPITLVVTYPAVWSDLARDRTLEAVEKAGFNKLEFPQLEKTITASEPECAAIYTMRNLRGTTQDTAFAIGDCFIVCDMGGGTVDLISYRVTGLNPTTVEEATIGNGDQCGGSFVDRAFFGWLENRVGSEDFVKMVGYRSEQIPHTALSKKGANLLQDFTLGHKSCFSGTETNHLRLASPLNAVENDDVRGICDGEILVKPEDMIKMFEFPVRRTYELIGEQLEQLQRNKKARIKYVFMVGGFSESPYMYNKISAFVKTSRLEAIRPTFAWSAVARGAAAKGLEGDGSSAVKMRKCRRYYGTSYSPVFVPGKHTEAESYIDSYDGNKRARGQMDWLLERGQDLATTNEFHAKASFINHFWPREKRQTTVRLQAADVDKAPQRSNDRDVKTVTTLFVDLSVVPKSEFKTRKSPAGKTYYQLNFEVAISAQAALKFSLLVDGKKYGSVTAKYE